MQIWQEIIPSNPYAHTFHGMEKDDEIKGRGNSLDFGARMYDSRLGRFLRIDGLFDKFPNYSPYCFVTNSPLILIDPDGNDIFVVTSNGKAVNISSPDAHEVKTQIGYRTLKATTSGKALLEKYENSSTDHIYIAVAPITEPNRQGETASTPVPIPESAVGATMSKLDEDRSVFNGIEIQAAGNTSFVVINEDFVNGSGEFVGGDNSVYEKAAVTFHEIKAHVDMQADVDKAIQNAEASMAPKKMTKAEKSVMSSKLSHGPKFYGSSGSGYNPNVNVTPGSPAAQIGEELRELKKRTEAYKQRKENKCDCN